MGGSSGGFFHGETDPEKLMQMVIDSKERTKDQQFDNNIAKLISFLLAHFDDRDTDLINSRLDNIKKALGKDIEGTVDLLFGGSVAKHTYVDGLSDVDALILLDKSELMDLSPIEVQRYILSRLKQRLPRTQIKRGNLAITVKFKDAEIQLLPSIRHKEGFRIPNSTGKRWAIINPKEFTDRLTRINKKVGQKLIPTIKLAKSIISDLPKHRRITGYHTEALALEIFRKYTGVKTNKAMLAHFFREATNYIQKPIKDKTGQSKYVDEYLGDKDSPQRKIVADALGRIGRRITNADGSRSIHQWRNILGDI